MILPGTRTNSISNIRRHSGTHICTGSSNILAHGTSLGPANPHSQAIHDTFCSKCPPLGRDSPTASLYEVSFVRAAARSAGPAHRWLQGRRVSEAALLRPGQASTMRLCE